MAVGPGLPGAILLGASGGLFGMNPLPVTGAKIHRPLLRADVLSRERLNGWLEEAAAGRLALIVAEAGFGKTTLLGDWARHTGRLTAWYRLEPDDRDWLTFVRHLVASGREVDPGFAPDAYEMLRQLGPGGPRQQDLAAALVREMAEFAASRPEGFTLIFDDYHLVDRCDETEPIVRALLEQTGPGFSLVIAGRTTPRLPLARLRARGGVSRLDGDALCFDVPEADRLFRDAYHQPLDPDVVTSLIDRTEGWPALLSLVHTNLDGSDAAASRRLVGELSGAAGDMYDFLAEEIVDRLPPDVSAFLMKASIIDEIDIETGIAITQQPEAEVVRALAAAEAFALVSPRDATTAYRILPIARELLAARLALEIGADGVRNAQVAAARRLETSHWRVAATLYEHAGDHERAALVIERSLESILGAGQYRVALDLLEAGGGSNVVRLVLESRLLLQIGATTEALASAEGAVAASEDPDAGHAALALQNAASIAIEARQYEGAAEFARRARSRASDTAIRDLSDAYADLIAASGTHSLPALALRLENLLATQLRGRRWHYAAITYMNLSQVVVWLDRSEDALRFAGEADRLLRVSSQGYEGVSVRLAQAHALAILCRWPDADRHLRVAMSTAHPEGQFEAVLEAATIAAWYGPPGLASQVLARVQRDQLPPSWAHHWRVLDLWISRGDARAQLLAALPVVPPPTMEVGAAFRWHLTMARSHLQTRDPGAFAEALSHADEIAAHQRSPMQQRLAAVLRAIGQDSRALSRLLANWPATHDAHASVFAREIVGVLGELADDAFEVVARAARATPHRWLPVLREYLPTAGIGPATRMASIVEDIGEAEDIARLRVAGRRLRQAGRGSWGDSLITRLAPRVVVEDLGLISISVGTRQVDGRGVRRKALALLAYLACQPRGAATPDRVIDVLWPDQDPEQGGNSLHQTIYFLRRVIEPGYKAGISPEYVHYDAEVVSLDPLLVDCRSWECQRLLSQRPETKHLVESVIALYQGQFAADFPYEDWAARYRDRLHARYLSLVERAVTGAAIQSSPQWRLWVGQQCLALDSEADTIEAQVIRLYHELGAPAAAAEQYAHYAAMLRDHLGVEPPQLGEILGDTL